MARWAPWGPRTGELRYSVECPNPAVVVTVLDANRGTSMSRLNIHRPTFTQVRDGVAGFRARRAHIGHALGTRKLGVSVWEVDPGQAAYPYHFHLLDEEVLVVLDGSPTLRTASDVSRLVPGDIVAFPSGDAGAHQVLNDTDAVVRFLAVSASESHDVCVYPDESKIGFASRAPSERSLAMFFRVADAVDYDDGIQPR